MTIKLDQRQSDRNKETIIQWVEIGLTILVFAVLMLFAYTDIFLKPDLGFTINLNTGIVTYVSTELSGTIELDDLVLAVNNVPVDSLAKSASHNPLLQTEVGEPLELDIVRNGEEIQVVTFKPPQELITLQNTLSGEWILPFPFFAAGLIAILFIRPRSATRTLLYLFFYCFAIWISSGLISSTNYWESSAFMRVFIWLSVPVSIHLHWIFPRPFSPWKKSAYFLVYGLTGLTILLDLYGVLPSGMYLLGFIITMVSALLMLLIKFIRFKDLRPIMRTLLSAYLISVSPLILMVFLMIFGTAPAKGNVALLGLTAIPGFYFFTAYQTSLKRDIPRVSFAMRLFIWGIIVQFTLMFLVMLAPGEVFSSLVTNVLAFSMIITLSLTDFGILLIMPALANDQINLFKTESYSLRFSANRAAALVNYLLVITPLTIILLFLLPDARELPLINLMGIAFIILTVTGFSVIFYRRFQAFFDRVVLGIQLPSEELLHNYLQKITTSLNADTLTTLLKDEILPSLLIRESILIEFQRNDQRKTHLRSGINDQDITKFMDYALDDQVRDLSVIEETFNSLPWVQLTLPLTFEEKIIGVWCMGWKDPNNVYDSEFTKMLETLAHQTTLTLLNIHQRELLHTLYDVNVERQEAEKAALARDLHDVLMPSLGYLVELQNNGADIHEFEQAVQQINDMVREIMSGLRPSSLDMGLNVALEELADQPEAQIGGNLDIQTNLYVPKPVNYDQNVELHLYRIVQQACRNAFEHAGAKSILISGSMNENRVDLTVADDGSGFPLSELPDLGTLMAKHHFGLANIFERAKLIGAEVTLESEPGSGTKVMIVWPPNGDR
ncbi:hypothetical protein KQH62_00640 [bacterium]|nr:hypothetical protein [bacterium]